MYFELNCQSKLFSETSLNCHNLTQNHPNLASWGCFGNLRTSSWWWPQRFWRLMHPWRFKACILILKKYGANCNIHILLQSVSRQLIVWVGFTSSINHLYFLSCCRFLKQHFVSNNNDSLVNYFLRNFLHLVPKIFYLKNNKSQHSHEMALIAENSKYWPRITSTD